MACPTLSPTISLEYWSITKCEALEAQLVHLLKDAPALAKMGQDASERAHRMFAEHISTASLAAVVRDTAR